MAFNIFDKVGDDFLSKDSDKEETTSMDLHPEGVYFLSMQGADMRIYKSSNLAVECEYQVVAKDAGKPSKDTGTIMEEPLSKARIWSRHFLFLLVDKSNPELGYRVNDIGSRIFLQMLQALSGYDTKEELMKVYSCDIEEVHNEDGHIINADVISQFYSDQVNMLCNQMFVKSEVFIRESNEYRSNELKWYRALSSYEDKALKLFTDNDSVDLEEVSEDLEIPIETDDDVPF